LVVVLADGAKVVFLRELPVVLAVAVQIQMLEGQEPLDKVMLAEIHLVIAVLVAEARGALEEQELLELPVTAEPE
jgi:hypothetical protein